MALILIIIIFIIIRMYLLTNIITMRTFSSIFRVHKCACVINSRGLINEYTYENGVQFEIKSFSVETLFFHSF